MLFVYEVRRVARHDVSQVHRSTQVLAQSYVYIYIKCGRGLSQSEARNQRQTQSEPIRDKESAANAVLANLRQGFSGQRSLSQSGTRNQRQTHSEPIRGKNSAHRPSRVTLQIILFVRPTKGHGGCVIGLRSI